MNVYSACFLVLNCHTTKHHFQRTSGKCHPKVIDFFLVCFYSPFFFLFFSFYGDELLSCALVRIIQHIRTNDSVHTPPNVLGRRGGGHRSDCWVACCRMFHASRSSYILHGSIGTTDKEDHINGLKCPAIYALVERINFHRSTHTHTSVGGNNLLMFR